MSSGGSSEHVLELATEKSKTQTQCYTGPVVNPGPYDGKIKMQIPHP